MSEPSRADRTKAHEPADALEAGLAEAFGRDSDPLPSSSVRRALGAEMPRVQLRDPDGDSPLVRPHSEQALDSHGGLGRYQLQGEIARGGMGAVLKGRDVELGRDVAVKVLLESHAGRTELLQRFVEEAQIAGQLQHPGVAPVYELGQFTDRRPYFAMKLVKGQTLAKLLAARKSPEEGRPRFLGIFLQACQAVAYAHARGVIHRDLKPSNVMVGGFGEVLVMDWGLAKVLPREGVADERAGPQRPDEGLTAIRTRRSEGSSAPGSGGTQTEAGSVLGTPAYMPPEQALGEVVDERADVFGLGAVLCEVLTGKPPYAGGDRDQLLRRAVRADLVDALARLERCGADAELVELTKRCLAAEPADRPCDAGAVADELSAHLLAVEQRLRQAELARAQAEVRAKEERKRRRVQLALAGAVALLLALAAGGGLYLQRQHELRGLEQAQRRREAEAAVEATLGKADELKGKARWSEAASLLVQTRTQLGDGAPPELRERVEQALADVALVGELDAIRLKRATLVEGKVDDAGVDREYAEAFRKHGLGNPGEAPAVVAARLRDSAIKEQLLAPLDDWAFTTRDRQRKAWLMEVARRADPHPWRDRLRDPAVWADTKKLHALAAEAKAEELSPQVAAALGWALDAGQAIALLRVVQRRHPGDFWVNLALGTLLAHRKDQDEAIGYLRVAVALRPTASAAHNNLGNALRAKGQVDEAIACFRKAIAIDPRFAGAHTNLGVALSAKGQVEEAIACYRKAIDIDPRRVLAHINLGAVLCDVKRDYDGAIACFRKAVAIEPRNAVAHTNLGVALSHKGKRDEATTCFRKALAIDPRLAQAHAYLGADLLRKGRYAEARDASIRAHDLLPANHPLRASIFRRLQACEHLLKLEERLPGLLQGADRPASALECLDFASICQHKQLHTAAARFYAEAFVRQPDLAHQHRYDAACSAALAGSGQGKDADTLRRMDRLALRRQALTWLRADLTRWAKLAERADAPLRRHIAATLAHWQQDADLAGLHDPEALKALPTEERLAFERLWADVQVVLNKLAGPAPR
jgi:serine/threonine-protein kinase